MLQALAALKYNIVVHHDLKPDNMLWQADKQQLVILDTDVAEQWKSVTDTADGYAGTRSYSAPEILGNMELEEGEVQHRYGMSVDVYSAGKTLEEVFESAQGALSPKQRSQAQELLSWMTAFDPKDRPTPEQVLQHPLLRRKRHSRHR